ncbi:hypothetical protein ANCCAN_18334 [Ancylostoma caninum]|uniref:Amino acid transporter transmembrane domain-containing protein n=1 Tax=Ancylostoma caninum TaxID=29170 RepID=A0A368FUM8_ANCCA|nr:hypothetical protein ANCCAN_18334 [Ancylostoma caninum]
MLYLPPTANIDILGPTNTLRFHACRHIVSICLVLNQFGIVTSMVLLASNNISNLCAAIFKFQINFCYVILIVGVLVWPFLMLKSPMSFWQAAIGAMITSIFAATFIVLGAIHDAPTCTQVATYPEYSLKNLFLAYGTIAYSFGGHGAFPTIQHDMVKPFRFNRSVWASYICEILIHFDSQTSTKII